MSFALEHVIAAPLLAVEAALLDRPRLALVAAVSPVIRQVQVLSWRSHGHTLERRILVSAEGLRALLGKTFVLDTIQWIDRLLWDRRLHRGVFSLDPQLAHSLRRQVHCHGEHRLIAGADETTRRIISCHVQVDLPGLEEGTLDAIRQVANLHFAKDTRQLTALAGGRARIGQT